MPQKTILEYHKDNLTISTDKSRLDISTIHNFLANESYWSKNIPLTIVQEAVKNSLCFGLYDGDRQIGFARVVSDYVTFAFLADVFIVKGSRGWGLSKWLLECIISHPELQGLRRWMLATRDAHELYAKLGFRPLAHPERLMEIHHPELYR